MTRCLIAAIGACAVLAVIAFAGGVARGREVETQYREDEDGVAPMDPRLAGEYGRLLAARDRLIAEGVDPADLLLPEQPL